MSSRPRYAGDGRLRLPDGVSFLETRGPDGIRVMSGRMGPHAYDPFERDDTDLLLAEAFARVDLAPTDALLEWFARHGVLDLARALPTETRSRLGGLFTDSVIDPLEDVAAQQRNIAWHLESIAHLSDHLVSQPGCSEGVPWQPRWAQPVLSLRGGYAWLGADDPWEHHILAGMERTAKAPRRRHPMLSEEEWHDWWRKGHAAWQRIVTDGVPVVRAVTDVGSVDPRMLIEFRELVAGDLTRDIGSGPWDLVELERRLMAPYIAVAGEHHVEVGRPDDEGRHLPSDAPLVVHERRTWDSLLAPVYVQLLEGLRRVTEGQRGGAFCKECGQPFLTLDARRSAFCTDRERYRYGQREHRRRAAGAKGRVSEGRQP